MNNSQLVQDILRNRGAIITDSHIVYTSGKHGTTYVDKEKVYPYVRDLSRICRCLAEEAVQIPEIGYDIDCVISPAYGGIALSQWVAHHLESITGREVKALYAFKTTKAKSKTWASFSNLSDDDEVLDIKSAYAIHVPGQRNLIIDDIATTGGSLIKLRDLVAVLEGEVIGAGLIGNRGKITAEMVRVPNLYSLVDFDMVSMTEEECLDHGPCSQGIPINKEVGHGREYLAHKAAEVAAGESFKPWCKYHMATAENPAGTDCWAHAAEGREPHKCPFSNYAIARTPNESGGRCEDAEPIST